MNILGLDIGGANTKAVFLKTKEGSVKEFGTALEYFPVWKNEKKQLPLLLNKLKKKLLGSSAIDGIGITTTAELSDAYMTKKEGINHVLESITQVFKDTPTFVVDVEAKLQPIKTAKKKYLRVASANWAATAWMISQYINNCIIIDVGSTTTSIVPVINGKIKAKGKTDTEKLQNGELIYSGSLRTNIATIVNSLPVREKKTRISSELFAQSGDVHLILGNIEKKEYTAETCDGRGKTRRDAMTRLARVICADMDILTEQEITKIAMFVYDKQIEQIHRGVKQVYKRIKPRFQAEIKAVVTGLGRDFLARKAAERAGLNEVIDITEYLGNNAALMSPSVGVALMVASKLEGKTVTWPQS